MAEEVTIVENPKLGDTIGILEFVLNEEKDKIGNSVVFPKLKVTKKGQKGGGLDRGADFLFYFLEKEPLLSSFPANPIVGILRSKKEGCSTRREQRVDSGFEDFRQTL